jgi:hypothetical protein
MLETTIDGADKVALVAKALRDLGDRDLSRELSRGLNRVTDGLKEDAKEEAGKRLPHRGGLAERVLQAKLSTRRKSGRNPGIRISAKGMDQLELMDQGLVRHRVFGQDVWVTQKITGGWFSDPMEAGRDDVERAIEGVLDEVAVKLAHRLNSP